jgi:hypothetical protein
MTATQTAERHNAASDRPVFADRFKGKAGTGRKKTAGGPFQGRNEVLIPAYQYYEYRFEHELPGSL